MVSVVDEMMINDFIEIHLHGGKRPRITPQLCEKWHSTSFKKSKYGVDVKDTAKQWSIHCPNLKKNAVRAMDVKHLCVPDGRGLYYFGLTLNTLLLVPKLFAQYSLLPGSFFQ
jgi:hypothetical protein